MTAAVETVKLRWSSTVVCARKAIYEAEQAPAREFTDRETRIMLRGQSIGRDVATIYEYLLGPDQVEREVPIPWEFGLGHADIYLRPTRTLVEVVSAAHATEQRRHVKLLQLVGYMSGHAECESGALLVVDPADLSEEQTLIIKGGAAYEALLAEARERVEQLRAHARDGVLPERVCRKPSEAIGRFCLHADYCFTGWEPPEPLSVVDDPETISRVHDWVWLKERERQWRAELEEFESERKRIEALLAERIEEAGEHQVGPYLVRRTDVQRSPRLDLRRALRAGVVDEELVAPYMKPGARYSTWQVTREQDAAADGEERDIDPGEVQF